MPLFGAVKGLPAAAYTWVFGAGSVVVQRPTRAAARRAAVQGRARGGGGCVCAGWGAAVGSGRSAGAGAGRPPPSHQSMGGGAPSEGWGQRRRGVEARARQGPRGKDRALLYGTARHTSEPSPQPLNLTLILTLTPNPNPDPNPIQARRRRWRHPGAARPGCTQPRRSALIRPNPNPSPDPDPSPNPSPISNHNPDRVQ